MSMAIIAWKVFFTIFTITFYGDSDISEAEKSISEALYLLWLLW